MPLTRIGSQLYVNRDDTPEQVRRWVAQMADAGLSLVRLFLLWDHLEPRRGQWTWESYDAAFDEAAGRGLGVVPTLMSVSPPGWMRLTGNSQSVADLEDPEFLARSEDYIRRVVGRYGAHPALHSWIVWNEASRGVPRNERTLARYREFQAARHGGDIARYNRRVYGQCESFADLERGPTGGELAGFSGYAARLDWMHFAVDEMIGHLARIRDIIRELDTTHPIHVNPHAVTRCMAGAGQSIWREGRTLDFLGCSAHPVWHSTRFPRARWPRSIGLFADLMRGAGRHPDDLFWVSELQGGPTFFSGQLIDCPDEADIRAWLWESLGSGAGAVVYWCFNARTDGGEAGEWSLLAQNGRPSRRLRATTAVIKRLARHQDVFAQARPGPQPIKLLYSEESALLANVEGSGSDEPGNPRSPEAFYDALSGAYLLLADLGHAPGFVDEIDVRSGLDPDVTPVIVLPSCTALALETLEALQKYVQCGGTLLADGFTAWKTPDGALDPAYPDQVAALFGAHVVDQTPPRPGERLTGDFGPLNAWFSRIDFDLGPASVAAARWDNGDVAATVAQVGQGRAIRLGTHLFHAYFVSPDAYARAWIKSVLPDAALPPLSLDAEDLFLRLRLLEHPEGLVVVLSNEGPAGTVLATPQPGYTLEPLEEPLDVLNVIPLPAQDAWLGFLRRLP